MVETIGLPGNLKLDTAGHIDLDLRCVACGYNLRGLMPDVRQTGSGYGGLLDWFTWWWIAYLSKWICLRFLVGITVGLILRLVAQSARARNA